MKYGPRKCMFPMRNFAAENKEEQRTPRDPLLKTSTRGGWGGSGKKGSLLESHLLSEEGAEVTCLQGELCQPA